ncbi:MAG: hypothetical protein V7603_5065 [Micromonosporaceae bacterium]
MSTSTSIPPVPGRPAGRLFATRPVRRAVRWAAVQAVRGLLAAGLGAAAWAVLSGLRDPAAAAALPATVVVTVTVLRYAHPAARRTRTARPPDGDR